MPASERATSARRIIFTAGSVATRRTASPGVRPSDPLCDDLPMELRVVRHTDRFDDACSFWGDLLGWPTTRSWPADSAQGRGRIFGYGETARVELIEVQVAVPVTGVFLGVQVDDVAAIVDAVTGAGHTLIRPLADQPWGHRNATVRDPSGIELTLFQVLTVEVTVDHDG